MKAIRMDNIAKTYPSKPPVVALNSVSFEIEENDTVALLGPNGAGKTTLLKILVGILLPDTGSISIYNNDAIKSPSKIAQFIRFLSESPFLLKNNNLWENAKFWFQYWAEDFPQQELKNIFDRFNLSSRSLEPISRYSRGMLQKSALSFMLATNAPIIILDEPTLGLDVVSVKEVIEIINELKKKRKTIIIASHDMSFVKKVANTVVLIDKGRIFDSESIENFIEKYGSPRFVISYIQDGKTISENYTNSIQWRSRLINLLHNNGVEAIEFYRETDSLEQILQNLLLHTGFDIKNREEQR